MCVSESCRDPLAHFAKCVPKRPYASDDLTSGVWLTPKWAGLKLPYIQTNAAMIWALVFDCDHGGAYWAARDGLLPAPNVVVLNHDNGKGHVTYFLKAPVPTTDAARQRPLRYLAKIERGMVARLEADPSYVGLVTKNPLHSCWRVLPQHSHLFELQEFDECLHELNCKRRPHRETCGLSRNCMVFDELRTMAYRHVRQYKRNGVPGSKFDDWAQEQAGLLNAQFPAPMHYSEVRGIARSVARWVWRNFDEDGFRRIQSRRGQRGNQKRWAGHVAISQKEPWKDEGISRATYYRRRKKFG